MSDSDRYMYLRQDLLAAGYPDNDELDAMIEAELAEDEQVSEDEQKMDKAVEALASLHRDIAEIKVALQDVIAMSARLSAKIQDIEMKVVGTERQHSTHKKKKKRVKTNG